MWRTNVQNQVSNCVTGSPVPLRTAHARVLWSGHRSGRPRAAERVLGLPAEKRWRPGWFCLKATILPREHDNALKGRDTRLDREDKEAAALDDLCDMVKTMSTPESAKDLDARSMPRVLTDNLLVESASGLTEEEVRSAVNTWLSVDDDEKVLRAEVEVEVEEVTENISKVHVEDDVSSEEKGDDGRQESCMKSMISEAEVRPRLEDVRSYLYANGRDGEYSETAYLLS